MFLDLLQMGCLSSRTTSVTPVESSSSRLASGERGDGDLKSSNGMVGRRLAASGNANQDNTTKRRLEASNSSVMSTDRTKNQPYSSSTIRLALANGGTEDGTGERGNGSKEDLRSTNSMNETDIMSILMSGEHESGDDLNNDDARSGPGADVPTHQPKRQNTTEMMAQNELEDDIESVTSDGKDRGKDGDKQIESDKLSDAEKGKSGSSGGANLEQESSFDDDLNMDLLRQYITIDFSISQLEDKDALRVYHEKIEQLEMLERELDMIDSEIEETGGQNVSKMMAYKARGRQNHDGSRHPAGSDRGIDSETNSLYSGATDQSISPVRQMGEDRNNTANNRIGTTTTTDRGTKLSSRQNSTINTVNNSLKSNNYTSIEDMFSRKIILERERDKLKKEVELVIIECDKLQQKYKKRDEILDKIFDGRTGNGLENHLEQQLNWLMEQKHYVDQVFYAWKRAETLTSQACEQFSQALELLKQLQKLTQQQEPASGVSNDERAELCENIANLLIKSRQDMEQAQRYNPNVGALFFTDNETERFDKIVDIMSHSKNSANQQTSSVINLNDFSQMSTIIQFAYKRAVSIRLWLEQILQITIARDSFELAEEYKWIAIQLRKERVSLIKSKLHESPYRSMAKSVVEQLVNQQRLDMYNPKNTDSGANRAGEKGPPTNETNRDSGIESDGGIDNVIDGGIDIEEEIYRVLEMNKSRFEPTLGDQQQQQQLAASNVSMANAHLTNSLSSSFRTDVSSNFSNNQRNQMMRERIERRVRDAQADGRSGVPAAGVAFLASSSDKNFSMFHTHPTREQYTNAIISTGPIDGSGMPTDMTVGLNSASAQSINALAASSKLKIELDEASRQNLLKQVDQTHNSHRDKMERLRGNNKARASSSIAERVQHARRQMDK